MKQDNVEHIAVLLRTIEQKLGWGDSSQWSSYDFDKLAMLIFDSSKTAISSNTLKRVWGRVKYDSKPSDVTLNTLAKFIGHKDYREFLSELNAGTELSPAETEKKSWLQWPPFRSRPSTIFVSGAVFMLVAVIALSYSSMERKYNPDDFYFTSRKVTKGLPNSVVFEYRAKNARENAKVEIQQSWDKSKRMDISREDSLGHLDLLRPGILQCKIDGRRPNGQGTRGADTFPRMEGKGQK